MLAILGAFFVFLAIYFISFYQKVRKYPAGPRPWPIFGNLFELPMENMHKYISSLKDQYGPVYTVWQPQPVVYIQDYEHVKDALVTHGDDYLGRSTKFPDTLFQPVENGGVIFSQGEQWREDRRISLQILRDFGMGKNIMEEQVRISTQECIEHIRSLPNKNKVDLRWPIQLLVGNVINRILFGYHYKYNDWERLRNFCDVLNGLIIKPRQNPFVHLTQKMPWIKDLPLLGHYTYGQYIDERNKMYAHVNADIERTLADYDIDQEPETFTQAYVQKMKKAGSFSYDRLSNVCMDFFLAGSETTSTSLRWSAIILAQFPEVQEKIRNEIHEKLGDRFPCMADRPNMPYTSAAVMELQRYANILSFNVTHRTTVDTLCGDYKIPADTQIQAMINTVMAEDPHFEDPNVYRPERFLESDGKTFKKELAERVIPFSMGKRLCAGEGLARMELFIGLISLVQNFRIKPPRDAPLDSTPIYGGIMLPPSNNFVIECL